MSGVESEPFGTVLKRHRERVRLTQEELAERAGLSVRGIRYLEQGTRQPYRDTMQRLVAALALSPAEEAAFAAAARLPGADDAVAPSTPAPRHNLPAALTSFVGREAEQAQVHALLDRHRLVTLCGTGGAGKTRLALTVAGALVERYADGVWLVELAALADPDLLASTVATALGLREEPQRSILATLTDYLQGKELLLVLDNCEHLVAGCAELTTALLGSCPRLHVLVTSREGLAVGGEVLYRVPSLGVPDLGQLPPVAHLAEYAAVRLFVERAQGRQAGFALHEENAGPVATICARLDGIPLAIELAAARVGSVPLAALVVRLDQSLRLLTGAARTAPSRQQTLRGALDWSWDLLEAQERLLLRRLAVFAGGWTLAAAEAVCADEEFEQERLGGADDVAGVARRPAGSDDLANVATWEVMDLLAALVNKSLVQLEERAGTEARYRLLEPVRQYAHERLAAAREESTLWARHLQWCVALSEQAEPHLTGPEQRAWLARLACEHDNLRAALRWSTRDAGAGQAAVQLAGALCRFWYMRGHLSEGRGWLEAALAPVAARAAPPALRAHALHGAGNLAFRQGDHARATALYAESLALKRDLGDTPGIATLLNNLGSVAERQGDYARAGALHAESLALRRALGDTRGVASSLHNLGMVAGDQGDHARAVALYEESLTLSRELGDTWGIASTLNNLGSMVHRQADYTRAAALLGESLTLFREVDDTWGVALVLDNLGEMAFRQGDHARAAACFKESLAHMRELNDTLGIAEAIELGALLAGALRCSQRAVQLWAAADGLRRAIGTPLAPHDQAEREQAIAALREALGETAFAAAWAGGQGLSLAEAIALALEGPAT